MLELARPEARARPLSHPERFSWGIVDLILGVVMLPFGIWLAIIEAMVSGVSRLADLPGSRY